MAVTRYRNMQHKPSQVKSIQVKSNKLQPWRYRTYRCEFVVGGDTLGLRELAQERRLAHGRKPDKNHTSVSTFHHVKSFAFSAALFIRFQKLKAILGQLGFQQTEMVLRR